MFRPKAYSSEEIKAASPSSPGSPNTSIHVVDRIATSDSATARKIASGNRSKSPLDRATALAEALATHKPTKKPNRFQHDYPTSGVTTIFVERRDGTVIPCLIDADKYGLVKDFRWHARKHRNKTFYIITNPHNKWITVGIHQLLFPGFENIDHKNHNRCDNRIRNLRPATQSQNLANRGKYVFKQKKSTSRFIGVSWHKNRRRFEARIQENGRNVFLGHFPSEIDAAKARDTAAIRIYSEYAALNFSIEQKTSEAA